MMYNFIIKFLVLETFVVSMSWTLNVRTVLFTHADLAKKEWNPRDVALLKARMYLQDLIPPMQVSQSPKYVSSLLRYIRDCYASVNREALDRSTESILTDALSDVIGGYLKMVALPVTKSVYYSGGLPTQDALQILKYYEDIKGHLHTRGTGWGKEVTGIQRINTGRGARSDYNVLKVKEPCRLLLYLQNAHQNLSMPMPSIDWNTRMMFVPLMDQPIVDLRSPYVAPILQKFHKVASACERSVTSDKRSFQDSFQDWVSDEVLPHLSDEDLYTAFKGILSLIDTKLNPETSPTLLVKPLTMSTNSMIIVSILILEFICCIPTLLYLLKKKNNKKSRSSSRLSSILPTCVCQFEQCDERNNVCYIDTTIYKTSSHSSPGQNQSRVNSTGDFVNYKKYSGMLDKANSDLSSVSGTRRSYSSITDVPTVIEDFPPTRKYSSKRDKRIQPSSLQLFRYRHTETDKIDVTQEATQVSTMALLPRATSTSTAINYDASPRQDLFSDTVDTVSLATIERDKCASKPLRKSKRFRKRAGSPVKKESNSPYSKCMIPIAESLREKNKVSTALSTADKLKLEIYGESLWDNAVMRSKHEKRVEFASHVSQNDRGTVKINDMSGDQLPKTNLSKKESIGVMRTLDDNKPRNVEDQGPTYEVRVDRNRQRKRRQVKKPEDREGISKNGKGILKGTEDKQLLQKGSRIPKRINAAPSEVSSHPKPPVHPSPRHRSLIPTLKRALDDSAILTSSPRETKFNITL